MSFDHPGAAYALDRVRRLLNPPVTVEPPPPGVRFLKDVEVPVRDGTVLRANLFLPEQEGRYPVVMCAHPYSKDRLPRKGRPLFNYRVMRQSSPLRFSAWTSWEAPDPGFWVPNGYALVNCDLRGFFRSEGFGDLVSDQEAEDYFDLIEWAGTQSWSNGKVGLNGVSYLALSQWKVAALNPSHLAAICPWEGFSDFYRDFARPGGIREDGFAILWSRAVGTQKRCRTDVRAEQKARELRDDWWESRVPRLPDIQVPALVCASFSDHNLHSRGSFRGFEQIGSPHKWLYTHRGGKWAVYYSEESLAFQRRFFDYFLKGEDNGMLDVPPVRLEVRDSYHEVIEVRGETAWPLSQTRWTRLYLHPDGTLAEEQGAPGALTVDARKGRASFTWTPPAALELTGPMKLSLQLSATADDVHLFAAVRKLRAGSEVVFEGSYGFGHDPLSHGWLKASHRQLDEALGRPWEPVHTHRQREPLQPGETVTLEVSILPCSTVLRSEDQLRLDLQGHWFFLRNPLLGQFPAGYEPSPPGEVTFHLGEAYLLVPAVDFR